MRKELIKLHLDFTDYNGTLQDFADLKELDCDHLAELLCIAAEIYEDELTKLN